MEELSPKQLVPTSQFTEKFSRRMVSHHEENRDRGWQTYYVSFTGRNKVLGFYTLFPISSVQFSSVTQSCSTVCDPVNCSTPGLPVHHQLPEFTQTHIHQVSDAIQPSHPGELEGNRRPSGQRRVYFQRSQVSCLFV